MRGFLARWVWEMLLVFGLAGLLPLLVAAFFHSLGKPSNDDWSYLNSLATLTQHGTLNFNHWASAFEVGQLLLAAPMYLIFGVHPVLAELWVWGTGMVGLFALAHLGRRCGVPRRLGLLILATLSLSPLFLRLDTTFMTDVPFFTCIIVALCFWASCRDRTGFEWRRWVALALVTLAFSVREPAAFAVLPILSEPIVSAHRRGDRRGRRRYGAIAGAWVVLIGALWLWRQGNPTATATSSVALSAGPVVRAWVTGWLPAMLGFTTLPLLLALSPWDKVSAAVHRRPNLTRWIVGLLFVIPALGVFITWAVAPANVQLGNVAAVDLIMPVALRALFCLIGLAGFTVTTLAAIGCYDERARLSAPDRRLLGGLSAVTLGYSASLLLGTAAGLYMVDRYWLVAIALVQLVLARACTLLTPAGQRSDPSVHGRSGHLQVLRRWGTTGALALLLLFGIAVTLDGGAWLYGEIDFTGVAATHLPQGYGPEDINSFWAWDAATYTARSSTPQLTRSGDYLYKSGDRAGSYFYIDNMGGTGACAPFTVKSTIDVNQRLPHAVMIGPVVHGVFGSYRSYLVHRTVHGEHGCL